jgi:hypothetical protein
MADKKKSAEKDGRKKKVALSRRKLLKLGWSAAVAAIALPVAGMIGGCDAPDDDGWANYNDYSSWSNYSDSSWSNYSDSSWSNYSDWSNWDDSYSDWSNWDDSYSDWSNWDDSYSDG